MAETNLPAEGRAGLRPPPDAPTEVSQPLRADAGTIIDTNGVAHRPIDKARANERELLPLTYKDSVQQAAAELAGTATPGVVQAPPPVRAAVQAAPPAPVVAATHVTRPPDPTQPAASNSDTPTRGIPGTAFSPHRAKDPLKVEGGFGSGANEYFALDGTEMREVVGHLLGELLDQAQNDIRIVGLSGDTVATVLVSLVIPNRESSGEIGFDLVSSRGNPDGDLPAAIEALFDRFHTTVTTDLRFAMAASYPEYAITITLTVKAHDADPGFTLTRHRREFDAQGEPETPPDALREELRLPIPGRQITMAGALGALSSDTRA